MRLCALQLMRLRNRGHFMAHTFLHSIEGYGEKENPCMCYCTFEKKEVGSGRGKSLQVWIEVVGCTVVWYEARSSSEAKPWWMISCSDGGS